MMEFLARVKAVLRRSKKHSSKKEYHYKTLTVNVERHQLDNDRAVELTLKEFELLRYLVENKGHCFKRDEILEKIWGYECRGRNKNRRCTYQNSQTKAG